MKITKIKVKIELIEDFLGTMPDNEIFGKYLAGLAPEGTDMKDETETLQAVEERGTTQIRKDDDGLFIYDYMLKGFLKAAGNCLKEQIGIKALKSKIEDFVFITERKIRFIRNGKTVQEKDGVLERPKQIKGAHGEKLSTLGKSEYVKAGAQLEFTIKLLDHKEIKAETISDLLDYGELIGLGQWRNGGYGSFKVLEFDEIK